MTDRDDSLEPIIEILKQPVELGPDLTQRVMSAIERPPPPEMVADSGPVSWWRRDWTIRLTPLRGLAIAAGLTALLFAVQFAARRTVPAAPPVALVPDAGRLTQFVLVAPGARAVTVVGDFNDWSMSATPLERAEGDGVWYVTVPLAPGRYRYAFIVDGKVWRQDPEAPVAEDEFGRPNSVLTVGGA